jgi:hypothetical protein
MTAESPADAGAALAPADDRPLIASAFNPVLRAGFRSLGIRQFMRLHAAFTG